MKPRQILTQTMMRTRYHEHRSATKPGNVDPAKHPPLAAETPRETDATLEWLAHIRHGRILVR